MRQFIKNNKPYAQTSREDFAKKYLSEGCVEVPVLYAYGTFIDAFWNGSEWIEGATPEEIAEANKPIVPEVVSRRQFKIALAVLGYNENDILNGIEQLPEPNKTIARISYIESLTFERYSSDLIFVATNFLGLTNEQIDEVFLTAITF